jgi:hypothetical protein
LIPLAEQTAMERTRKSPKNPRWNRKVVFAMPHPGKAKNGMKEDLQPKPARANFSRRKVSQPSPRPSRHGGRAVSPKPRQRLALLIDCCWVSHNGHTSNDLRKSLCKRMM